MTADYCPPTTVPSHNVNPTAARILIVAKACLLWFDGAGQLGLAVGWLVPPPDAGVGSGWVVFEWLSGRWWIYGCQPNSHSEPYPSTNTNPPSPSSPVSSPHFLDNWTHAYWVNPLRLRCEQDSQLSDFNAQEVDPLNTRLPQSHMFPCSNLNHTRPVCSIVLWRATVLFYESDPVSTGMGCRAQNTWGN